MMNRETQYTITDAERQAIEIRALRDRISLYELKIISLTEENRALRELQMKTRKIIHVQPPEFRGPSQ
jgi:cell shape-determining protein MreC